MKKLLLLIVGLTLFVNCKQKVPSQKTLQPLPAKQVFTEKGEPMLLGPINRANLADSIYAAWFKESYDFYRIPENWSNNLKIAAQDLELVIFMGTWCEDTQRELGGIFKLIDALEISEEQISMFALTEDKDSAEGFEKPYEIINIPTVIFKKEGVEINRIVELPVETLHEDIQKILTGLPYQNAYDF
ncbi:MAG: hypothetical protein ACPGVF_06100 [Flavobacteriaceae bacterium]